MDNIFDALRSDHDVQRRTVARLVETTGTGDGRIAMFATLRAELAAHATFEERHFYVPLMGDDRTQEKARHSVAEHKELDDLVERLEAYDPAGPHWLVTARELEHRLVHHLDEEENEVFQLAGKVLTEDQKTELAGAYEDAMAARRRTG